MTPIEQFYTDQALFADIGATLVFDVESYPNYFLVSFQNYVSKKICFFELHENSELQRDWIKWILSNFCIVGFNSKNYDIIMVSYAISDNDITTEKLHTLSNEIILENARPRDCAIKYNFYYQNVNHIDLIEVCPLSASLKTYAGRLHCEYLQDLPYHPQQRLTREEKNLVRQYNFNDLDGTGLILSELSPYLTLRAALSQEFGKDLRSLSDARLAQEIINTELQRVTGTYPKRPDFKKIVGSKFKYIAPSYIKFKSQSLQNMLADIQSAEIEVGATGHVICPKTIEGRKIHIVSNTYTIGMGGLHSNEKSQALVTGRYRIIDRDVTGYYPNLMLKNKFFPKHLGEAFLDALQAIVDRRYKAKKEGNKEEADGLKIASNGTFGKTSDPYSTVYDPAMMVQTTLTGQLSILMLIELLTDSGFIVASANTDGIVTLVEPSRYEEFCNIVGIWENLTALETEETEYKALYSRDVNNYIAIKMNNEYKVKGVYSEVGSALNSRLSKNPECFITTDAAIAHIIHGTPIADTIKSAADFKRFVSLRKVTGGAQKDGRYLGKTIRWYYATGILGTINRSANGHIIPLTQGAKPCMRLPVSMPSDIDYDYYIERATATLEDVGFNIPRGKQFDMTSDLVL